MKPPKWAENLLLEALTWWESQGNQVPTPELRWIRRNRFTSAGKGCSEYIKISAGHNRLHAKILLLHETAHAIVGRDGAKWHSSHFWDVTWALYRWARLPIRYCRQIEGNYRKGALMGYRRSIRKEVL